MHENGFEEIDHTADAGIRVTAETLEQLLLAAARGMLHIMLGQIPVAAPERLTHEELWIPNESDAPDTLLHAWLSELLYQLTVRKSVPVHFDVRECRPASLRVTVSFQPLTREEAAAATEIKAVTWHGLTVERATDGWRAEVIFDT